MGGIQSSEGAEATLHCAIMQEEYRPCFATDVHPDRALVIAFPQHCERRSLADGSVTWRILIPEGDVVVSGCECGQELSALLLRSGRILVIDHKEGKIQHQFSLDEPGTLLILMRATEGFVAAGSEKGCCHLWSLKEGTKLGTFRLLPGESPSPVTALDLYANGGELKSCRLTVGYQSGIIRQFGSTQPGPIIQLGTAGSLPVKALSLMPNVGLLLVVRTNSVVRVWDMEESRSRDWMKINVSMLQYVPRYGMVLCASDKPGELYLVACPSMHGGMKNPASRDPVVFYRWKVPGQPPVHALHYNPISDAILLGCSDYTVRLGELHLPSLMSGHSKEHGHGGNAGGSGGAFMGTKPLPQEEVETLVAELISLYRTESPAPPQGASTSKDSIAKSLAVPDEEAVEKLSYLKEIIAAMESYPRSSGDDRILQALQKGLEEVERSGNNFLQDVFHRASDGRSRLTTSVEEQLFPEKGMERLKGRMQKDREELLERHRIELLQLEELHEQELKVFQDHIPEGRRYAAGEYHRIMELVQLEKHEYTKYISRQVDALMATTLQFPDFSPRYLILSPLQPGNPNQPMLLGYDRIEHRRVSIRSFPGELFPLDTSLAETTEGGVLQVLDIVYHGNWTYVVTEPVLESLEQYLRRTFLDQAAEYRLEEGIVKRAFSKLVKTVSLLHESDIMHRDLRPSTVYITSIDKQTGFFEPKVLHVGLRAALKGMEPPEFNTVFASPEVLMCHITYQSDIFSLGMLFLTLLESKEAREDPLFLGDRMTILCSMLDVCGSPGEQEAYNFAVDNGMIEKEAVQLAQKALDGDRKLPRLMTELVSGFTEEATQLLRQMVAFLPTKRLPLREALEHPFFTSSSSPSTASSSTVAPSSSP